ncbi:MAG: NlpC/P60 family protein, partial [Gammaproteobacteria bacterium]|nr:NlpC/P60 family protein [Gammaproteobacteria bacterium]
MFRILCLLIVLCASFLNTSCAPFSARGPHEAITRTVPVNDLARYHHYHSNVKRVISRAKLLSKKHLTYIFGSDDPRRGGMDCSGVIYYLLKHINNIYVPRDSYGMYIWLERAGKIHHVTSNNFHSNQFNALKPGDLLFWTGTYRTNRKPPITHVMLYLGKNKNNEPLMFGSSDGGIYKGTEMWGVGVFDF